MINDKWVLYVQTYMHIYILVRRSLNTYRLQLLGVRDKLGRNHACEETLRPLLLQK